MSQNVDLVIDKIAAKNPRHAQKLRLDLQDWDQNALDRFDRFYDRYENYLDKEGHELDYGVDAYLQIIEKTLQERMRLSLGNRLFSEPQLTPEAATDSEIHLNGMMLARFLWRQQFSLSRFYQETLGDYVEGPLRYLELCGDQWVWVEDTMDLISWTGSYEVMEFNEGTSDLAHDYMSGRPISFLKADLDSFEPKDKYDLIVLGQILGRMEDPLRTLLQIKDLLNQNGTVFFSATVNAPVRSRRGFSSLHILKELISEAGFAVEKDITIISNDLPMDRVEPLKAAISYGAFLKKK
ncbi:MAG: methyltransferase domain-containing protein [Bacteroidia bacterium]